MKELDGPAVDVRRSRLFRFAILVAFWVAAFPGSSHAAGSYLPTGIYALVPRDQTTIDPAVLNHPDVTGLQIRASWSTLQKLSRPPDFTYFDNLVAQAGAKSKKVILAVHRGLAGDGLPNWLRGSTFSCLDKTRGPVPWDATYQDAWIALWTALVKRYESDPAVTGYHIGGIYSWKTSDWDLCDASPADRQNWLKRGYRVEYIQQFALKFAAALAANTRKPFILPIAGTMDNSATVSTSQVTDPYIITPLWDRYGPNALLRQFGIMRTTFDDTTPDPLAIWNTDSLGDQFGVLYNRSPHIAGQRKAIVFDLAALGVMLDISLHYRVQFMELGTDQILLPGADAVLACYRDALVDGTPAHCVHE